MTWTVEQATRIDPADLEELFEAARRHDEHDPLGEHKWLDLVHGGRRSFSSLVAHQDGRPVGYAHLSRHPGEPVQWGLEIVVHPEHRWRGIESDLGHRALEVMRAEGGGHVHHWVFRPSKEHDELAGELGLRRGRDLLHMHVALPVVDEPELPVGVRIRSFEAGRDEDAWLEVNNLAFDHHPEQGAWDRETFERRMAEPWFDPADLLLATDDAGLAGFNWIKVDHQRSAGEIYVIAVHPSRQGTGLGRALSLVGLHHMTERGLESGYLYVDAANEAAVAMYTKLGFEVHHLDRAYVADVPP